MAILKAIPFLFCTVIFLIACNSQSSRDQYPVTKGDSGTTDFALVKKLYDGKCAICHGFDGRQKYAGAKDISVSTLTRDETIAQITNGKGTMPPQKDVLSETQITALADFVIQLRAK